MLNILNYINIFLCWFFCSTVTKVMLKIVLQIVLNLTYKQKNNVSGVETVLSRCRNLSFNENQYKLSLFCCQWINQVIRTKRIYNLLTSRLSSKGMFAAYQGNLNNALNAFCTTQQLKLALCRTRITNMSIADVYLLLEPTNALLWKAIATLRKTNDTISLRRY
jgi:hypothetical protein